MSSHDLHHIQARAALGEDGMPFCRLVINNGQISGQMNPADARALAMHLLWAAEAAESDAAVMRVLIDEIGLPIDSVATAMARIHARRTPPPAPETAPDADVDGSQA